MADRLPRQDGEWIDRRRTIRFRFEGRTYGGHEGDTLSSALWANGVRVLGQSGVRRSVESGSVVGTPAEPEKTWARKQVHLGKLDSLFKRVKKLERLHNEGESE